MTFYLTGETSLSSSTLLLQLVTHFIMQKEPTDIMKTIRNALYPYAMDLNMDQEVISKVTLMCEHLASEAYQCTYSFKMEPIYLNVGNVNWIFSIERTSSNGYKCVFELDPKTSATKWSLRARLSVIFNNTCDYRNIIGIGKFRYSSFTFNRLRAELEMNNYEFAQIFNYYDSIYEDGVQTPNMRVRVMIQIVEQIGFRNRGRVSYDFSSRTDGSDFMLAFPGKSALYVNLGYLAQLSDYFASLYRRLPELSKDKSSGLPFETLSDVDCEEFACLLAVVYPSKQAIDDDNVCFLLPLADRFLFEGVLSLIEQFLISPLCKSTAIDVFMKLQWSCTYQMADLQDHALSQLTSTASIKMVRSSKLYENLSPELTTCLFEAIMNMC